jgi:SAM-dependent methyltransferase
MKKLSDAHRWHIQIREKFSEKEADYLADVIRFFERRLNERYSSILDIPCGNGRLHPFLRKSGFEVFGIDSSNELIEHAKKRFPKFKNSYKTADMRNFALDRSFDVALSWFTSFGYFGEAENLRILKRINAGLRKNGLLLLDIPNSEYRIKRGSATWAIDYGDFMEIDHSRIKRIGGRTMWFLKEKFFLKKNRNLKFLEEINRKLILYSKNEITRFVGRAGFKVIEIFTSQTFARMDENTNQMLVICRKL